MAGEHTIGIKLKADGSGLSGALRLSNRELEKLARQAGKSGKGMGILTRGSEMAAKQMDKLRNTGSRLKSSLFSLKSAVAGVGLGVMAKSFLDAAATSESFRVRLTVLLGSAREGNRLFKEMADYAGRVPFEYREIMDAATQLSGIMAGGVDEISAWMPLIGDLAATSGLSIQTATEQVTRMLSSGAASADLFRERGILAMLGFQAGVSVSAEETRDRLIAAWTDTNSKFRGATDKLSRTWEGTMSMLSDKWFAFRNEVMDAGLFDYLKSLARAFNDDAGKAMEESKDLAKAWSEAAISGIEAVIKALAIMLPVWNKMLVGLKTLQLGFETIKFAAISAYNLLPGSGFNSQEEKQAAIDMIDRQLDLLPENAGDRVALLRQRERIEQKGFKDHAAQAARAAKIERYNDELHALINNPDILDGEALIQKVRDGVNEVGEAADKSTEQVAALHKKMERPVKYSADKVKAIEEQIEKSNKALDEELTRRQRALKKRVASYANTLKTEREKAEAHYQDQVAAFDAAEKAKLDLGMEYDELRARARKEHEDTLSDLQKRSDAKRERQAKENARRLAEQLPEPFKNALRDIQSQFTSFFENVFRGGVNSFADLAKAVKNIFIKLAANLATLKLFDFVKSKLAGPGTATGAGGLLNMAGSLLGPSGGAGGALPMPGMNTGIGGWIDGLGAKWGFGPGNMGGLSTPGSAGSLTMSSLSSVLGAGGIGFAGGGLFADLVGLHSKGGSIGGGIGAAIGMATPLGPVGALIGGGLGSLVGGLFGKKKSDKTQGITLTSDRIQQFGLTGKKFDQQLRQAADGIGAELQRALASIEDQIGAKLAGSVQVKLGRRDGNYVRGRDGRRQAVRGDADAVFKVAMEKLINQVQGGDKKLLEVLRSAFARSGDINQALSAVGQAKAVADQIKGLTAESGPLVALNKRFAELRQNATKYGLSLSQVNQAYITSLTHLKEQTRTGLQQIAGQARQLLGIDGLKQFRQSLSYAEHAPLSPLARFHEAKSLLDKEAKAALAGDIDAGNRFPQLAQQVLQLGRVAYASGDEYGALFKEVNTTLNQVIGARETTLASLTEGVNVSFDNSTNKQIEALREMKDALLEQEKKAEARLVEIRNEIREAEAERRAQEEAAAAARARQEKEIVRGHDADYWRGRYAGVPF